MPSLNDLRSLFLSYFGGNDHAVMQAIQARAAELKARPYSESTGAIHNSISDQIGAEMNHFPGTACRLRHLISSPRRQFHP